MVGEFQTNNIARRTTLLHKENISVTLGMIKRRFPMKQKSFKPRSSLADLAKMLYMNIKTY